MFHPQVLVTGNLVARSHKKSQNVSNVQHRHWHHSFAKFCKITHLPLLAQKNKMMIRRETLRPMTLKSLKKWNFHQHNVPTANTKDQGLRTKEGQLKVKDDPIGGPEIKHNLDSDFEKIYHSTLRHRSIQRMMQPLIITSIPKLKKIHKYTLLR